MSKFVDGLDAKSEMTNRVLGENGAAAVAQIDPRVAMFFGLVRKADRAKVREIVRAVVQGFRDSRDVNVLADLVLLTFQLRDVRGGKAEKQLFHWVFLELYALFPGAALQLGERPLRPRRAAAGAQAGAAATATTATKAAAAATPCPATVDQAEVEVPAGWESDVADGREGCQCLLPLRKQHGPPGPKESPVGSRSLCSAHS